MVFRVVGRAAATRGSSTVKQVPWSTSDDCRSCHPDQHASWHRTFHRTMTQEASPESVVGAFDGRVVTF